MLYPTPLPEVKDIATIIAREQITAVNHVVPDIITMIDRLRSVHGHVLMKDLAAIESPCRHQIVNEHHILFITDHDGVINEPLLIDEENDYSKSIGLNFHVTFDSENNLLVECAGTSVLHYGVEDSECFCAPSIMRAVGLSDVEFWGEITLDDVLKATLTTFDINNIVFDHSRNTLNVGFCAPSAPSFNIGLIEHIDTGKEPMSLYELIDTWVNGDRKELMDSGIQNISVQQHNTASPYDRHIVRQVDTRIYVNVPEDEDPKRFENIFTKEGLDHLKKIPVRDLATHVNVFQGQTGIGCVLICGKFVTE